MLAVLWVELAIVTESRKGTAFARTDIRSALTVWRNRCWNQPAETGMLTGGGIT